MQTLYLGIHHGRWLEQLTVPLCVTVRTMETYRDDWETHPKCFTSWCLDSGAYVEISKYGQWRRDPDLFGGVVTRILDNVGTPPDFCAPQDWPCERQSLAASGLTVAVHQELTIESVCYLRAEFRHIPWIPVVQGWHVDEYVDHVAQYHRAGIDLTQEPLVGLGSVCRRTNLSAVIDIITTLYDMGIRLHGFGPHRTVLARCGRLLDSADSLVAHSSLEQRGDAQLRPPRSMHELSALRGPLACRDHAAGGVTCTARQSGDRLREVPMSVKRDRKNSIPGWKIPECGQWVWTRKPDPTIDGDRGAGYVCRVRATHHVTHGQTGHRKPSTEHACQAHVGDLLDHLATAHRWDRQLYGIEHPPSVVTQLTFTVDEKAAAYGRRRFLRTERIVTDAIAQALIAAQTAIPPAKPRRDRTRRSHSDLPHPVAVQQTLFDAS